MCWNAHSRDIPHPLEQISRISSLPTVNYHSLTFVVSHLRTTIAAFPQSPPSNRLTGKEYQFTVSQREETPFHNSSKTEPAGSPDWAQSPSTQCSKGHMRFLTRPSGITSLHGCRITTRRITHSKLPPRQPTQWLTHNTTTVSRPTTTRL